MEYDIKDKIEWTVVFLVEFGKRHYDYLHTQSFASVVDDMTEYCGKMGGGIR